MTNYAKELTLLTGGCWHEPIYAGSRICNKCGVLIAVGNADEPFDMVKYNPTYSHADEILNLMKGLGEKKYNKFINSFTAYTDYRPWTTYKPTVDFINEYILNPSALLQKAVEFFFERRNKMKRQFFIAGVQFRPREDTGKACKFLQAGDYLFLKREPSNKFDPNAVQILVRQELISHDVADAEGVFLGYVPKKFSSEISAMMEIGASLNCVIDEVNSSAKTYEMFKVTVSIPVDEEDENYGADVSVGDGPDFDEGCREEG